MSNYIDGFVLAIPKKNIDLYKKMAKSAGKIWMDHGAIGYYECIQDDVNPGEVTSFQDAVLLKKDEVVFFSFVIYKSKSQRDKANKKIMADPRILKLSQKYGQIFDHKRMIYGGFKPVVKINR